MIEIVLCKRDGNGNKTGGKELISVGQGGKGCNTTTEHMAQMVGDRLTKGTKGEKKRKALDKVFGATTD